MMRFLLFVPLTACAASQLPPPKTEPGRAVPLTLQAALPENPPTLIVEPTSSDDRVGRAPRRLSVDQLRTSLMAATGFTWVAPRRVSDPDSPGGTAAIPDADMLEALSGTLGKPDYVSSTHESLDPAVTFSKLAGDAARAACRASVQADIAAKGERRILRRVSPNDTLTTNARAVRENLSYLALRFWARRIPADDHELDALAHLFERASQGTSPTEGWRAVCIALATDPQFLTY
jgi:hypothetical protein